MSNPAKQGQIKKHPEKMGAIIFDDFQCTVLSAAYD
jgi:hypothetical protein